MSVEDRVTAALHALADGTAPPVDGEHRLSARLRREHRNRRVLAAVGTAAAVFAVVGVVSLAGSSGSVTPAPLATHGPPSVAPSPEPSPDPTEASPAPAPTYPPPASGVGGPRWFFALEPSGGYGVHDARTGSAAIISNAHRVYSAVAAAGDDRTFWTVSNTGTCGPITLDKIVLQRGEPVHAATTRYVPGTTGLRGEVGSMAVSHDGTQLAYAITTKIDPTYGECSTYELRVLDLRSGATRAWTGGDASVSALNWAPDDRTLLMHVNGCCGDYEPSVSRLDTRAPGTSFVNQPTVPGTDRVVGCGGVSSTASSETEVFAVQECLGEGQPSLRIVVIEPVTGRVLRRVATIEGVDQARSLSVSDDGTHVLLSAVGFDADGTYRVDDGVVSKLPAYREHVAL
jgi:hypothetical protein